MVKYLIPAGFKFITPSGDQEIEEDWYGAAPPWLGVVDLDGNSFSNSIFYLWSPSDLLAIQIKQISDPGYDTARYELTGTPTDTEQEDGSFVRSYDGALTEWPDYIDTLRTIRADECSASWSSKVNDGVNFSGSDLTVKVKSDKNSSLSFDSVLLRITRGDTMATSILDYNNEVVYVDNNDNPITVEQLGALAPVVVDYHYALRAKKWDYFYQIAHADREDLDGMVSWDWDL
jgi:hypothetical protein